MLAFVDESGDSGRKILNGSSLYFVVAVVTFEDHDDALACDHRIGLLRRELGMPPGYEFHFSENPKEIRQSFLAAVSPYHFFYHVFALNKDPSKLYGPGFDHKESLYKYAVRLTFQNARPFLADTKVVIDRSGDRDFQREFATYLRSRIKAEDGGRLIKSVKQEDSKANNLLQLADYVAGVSNRHILRKPEGIELRRKYLAPHELSLQTWPR